MGTTYAICLRSFALTFTMIMILEQNNQKHFSLAGFTSQFIGRNHTKSPARPGGSAEAGPETIEEAMIFDLRIILNDNIAGQLISTYDKMLKAIEKKVEELKSQQKA
ncbi:hypothetical protein E3N88_02231 [Mikania micrantha]|uniref:Uncharacterized protein n=1 Tax=Mikania micrantha TaxID=192012 RepID=A0A5N6Q379_9ASTR|nr:hypothetical protein E3N88_02231 [Mikania micrantha]